MFFVSIFRMKKSLIDFNLDGESTYYVTDKEYLF